jgi:methionine sulfoxide reductase catalytic subunit
MANVILPPGWQGREQDVTPEAMYWSRRRFVRTAVAATAAASAAGGLAGCLTGSREAEQALRALRPQHPLDTIPPTPTAPLYPGRANPVWDAVERPLTDRLVAATHNNFYEFLTDKARVWENTGPFEARPWTIEVVGEVERPGVFDLADLERDFGVEERIYRLRCVEAWAMTVPWNGFPLAALLDRVQPRSSGAWVRFVSFDRPDQAVGQRTQPWYPWPYYEALRMDEARHPLTLVATGIYGAPLPKQHGAPARIIVPWKYGFKSPKSIVRIEVVREQPGTLWNDLQPEEYGFYSNVNPGIPHPRWSQAAEELIGTDGVRVPTLPLNGYAEWLEGMYSREILTTLS